MLRSISPGRTALAEYDSGVLWAAVLLLVFGLVMVYSASIAMAEATKFTGGKPAYFLERQTVFLVASVVAGMLAFQVPMRVWQMAAPWLFLAGVVSLVLLLVPGLGREVNGARRWLSLGVANLQPSEFMKLFAVLYAADYTVRKLALMHSLRRGLLPMFGVMLVVGWLLLREPDFGAFVVITAIATAVLFLGGMNGRWFGGLLALMALGFIVLVLSSPYRMQRIFGFMDPWSDPFGRGYQLSHALIAFGRGEWFGVGLGASVEKLLYLPEAHTRFPAGGDRRGTRLRRRADRDRAVLLAGAARLRDRPAGGHSGASLRGAGGAGHRGLVRRADAHQHGREHGPAAYQGPDLASHEFRRQRTACELHGAGGAAADRLGEPPDDARAAGMRRSWREPS